MMRKIDADGTLLVGLPSIKVEQTNAGYRFTAVPSVSFLAKMGSLVFGLFCLTFLLAGVVVWVLPDHVFEGDPFFLKCIVTGTTWVIFAPMFYFSFVKKSFLTVEVDMRTRNLHEVFTDKNGRETKRRSHEFSTIKGFELKANEELDLGTDNDPITHYGQIFMRIGSTGGRSLIWGLMKDLEPVYHSLRQDVLVR